MSRVRLFALLPALAAGWLAAADVLVEVPVLNKTDVTLRSRDDGDVQSKDLWYSRHDGTQWGQWQKHSLPFGREDAVLWSVPEGRWRTYVQYTEISTLQSPAPAQVTDAGLFTEFVIDRTSPAVAIQNPASQAKLRGGNKVTIRWGVEDLNMSPDSVTIEYARAGDGRFDAVAKGLANSGTFEWLVPTDMTISGAVRVTATDKAGNVGSKESTQLLIDSIAPSGRVTGPTISANLSNVLNLQIADAGPAGLASARLMVSQDNGQTWTEGPVIEAPYSSVKWVAERDGRFRFAVVAVDQAGNSSPSPRGATDDQSVILVDTTKPTVVLAQANGVVEAEGMKPRTAFRDGVRAAVQFDVKDVALAATPVTVWISTTPGKWEVLGEKLASDAAFRFEIPATASRTARIKVTAVDQAGNVGEVIAPQTFIIATEVKAGPAGLE